MAKNKKDAVQEEQYGETGEAYGSDMDDFDIEEEFTPIPLIAEGFYNAAITDVKFNSEDKTIDWSATLNNNGGVMSDGETPIDGSVHTYRNWLPKPGDETERTKKGTQTKRQAKINMMHDFAEGMKVTMSTPRQILEAIANSDWIGMEVQVKMGIRTWEGRIFNNVDRMIAA
ncbi:MAG: hypothetical protein IMF19_04665 [Proteobacteria bacterium]|nr:hypothetical protein [Pseudomonadota bacterium]